MLFNSLLQHNLVLFNSLLTLVTVLFKKRILCAKRRGSENYQRQGHALTLNLQWNENPAKLAISFVKLERSEGGRMLEGAIDRIKELWLQRKRFGR